MNDRSNQRIPTVDDVRAASQRLAPFATLTPLLRSPALDDLTGGRILLKVEALQRTGSFKFRGAFNRLAQLSDEERRRGVVAWSSGNHAQGVAAAGQILKVPTTIVMPRDAPEIKTARTRASGAEIVFYDRAREDREAIARSIAKERGAAIVPSYDDPDIIAGQGTVGLEVVTQADALGLFLDDVLVPVSGGGLAAGVGLAAKAARATTAIYCVEPAGYDDHCRSLSAGTRIANTNAANALCDALLAPTPGVLTWQINRHTLSGGYAVSDEEVRAAMAFAFAELKIVAEPGGAVALAAVLSNRHHAKDRTVGVILSGGNVDPDTFESALRSLRT